MRVIFMGTPDFSVPSLRAIAECEGHELVAVFSRADAASGRGKTLYPSPVKAAALELGADVFTPATLRDLQVQEQIAALAPDVIVVAAFGMILPKEVLEIPTHGCINVHASALPRWRGAAPVQRAILSGDETAGVCIMRMEEGLDTGDYHAVANVEVGANTTEELTHLLAHEGAAGLIEALDALEQGTYEWTAQDEREVTYAEKIVKTETLLRPGLTGHEFLRRVQASSKSAPARCVVCGKTVTIVAAHAAHEALERGQVVLEKKRILLGCKGTAVQLDVVKPEGKREMEAQAWLAGLRNAEPVWDVLPGMHHELNQ